MTNLRELLVARAHDTRPGVRSREQPWTWAEHVAESSASGSRPAASAVFGADGEVTNLDDAVGGNDDTATAERMRGGMYWSGDLGHLDATNKVFKGELVRKGLDVSDPVWCRDERGTSYTNP